MARAVEEGRGVIASVYIQKLGYYGPLDRGAHAITVTSVTRNALGDAVGFHVCDSNGRPSQFIWVHEMERALTGRPMNVTANIIR